VKLVGGDTMNYWINDHRENLLKTLKGVDIAAHQRHRNQAAGRERKSP
jgi:hypothetical protein